MNPNKRLPKSLFIRLACLFRFHFLLRSLLYFFFRLKYPSRCFKFRFEDIEVQFYVSRANEFPIFLARRFSSVGERYVLSQLLRVLEEGDCAYDVGASIGSHTILMAKKVGKTGLVVAFEPELHSYNLLKRNVALNQLGNVRIYPYALGDTLGKKDIFSPDAGLGSFNILSRGKNLGQSIQLIPGDLWIEENKLPLPRVVKIDVEGYEFYVLQGLKETLLSQKCQVLCCEIHPHMLPPAISAEDVLKLIQSFDFNRIETQFLAKTYHIFCYKDS